MRTAFLTIVLLLALPCAEICGAESGVFPNIVGTQWVYEVREHVLKILDTVQVTVVDTAQIPGSPHTAAIWVFDPPAKSIDTAWDTIFVVPAGEVNLDDGSDTMLVFRHRRDSVPLFVFVLPGDRTQRSEPRILDHFHSTYTGLAVGPLSNWRPFLLPYSIEGYRFAFDRKLTDRVTAYFDIGVAYDVGFFIIRQSVLKRLGPLPTGSPDDSLKTRVDTSVEIGIPSIEWHLVEHKRPAKN